MARSYARIITTIWRNKDFLALPGDAQRAFLLLVTQPDITAAGTLPLTIKRWSGLCSDWDAQQFTNALKELVSGRFVCIDGDTEELLIRSFVRWDGGHTNSKRRPVILEAAGDVASNQLRRVLAEEFRRLDIPADGLADSAADSASDAPCDSASGVELEGAQVFTLFGTEETSSSQVDSLSAAVSGTASHAVSASERVVVGYVSTGEPQPATRNPQPEPPSAPRSANQRANDIAQRYRALEPMSRFPAIAKIAKTAIDSGKYTDEAIALALEALAREKRTVTTESLRVQLDGRQLHSVPSGHQRFVAPDQSVYD